MAGGLGAKGPRVSGGGPDPTFADWDRLGWQERRQRRFDRWLNPPSVSFASEAAHQDYRDRVQLLIDAISLQKPARVPVALTVGFFVGKHSGLTKKQAMHDYAASAKALTKYHEDFRPDFQTRPVAPARVFDLLGLHFVDWPGRGLADDTPWQYHEAEYMKPEEYDALIADPDGYFRRVLLPRFGEAFAPLAAIGPFSDITEAASLPYNLLPFADAAVVEGVQRLTEAARESFAYLKAMGAAAADAAGRLGIPPEVGGSAKAPYDVLADTLRGTKGIMLDRFRQPDKILAVSERFVPLMIDQCVRQAARADSPLIAFWLHKGSDGFMSDSDFRTFYWPTLKAVMKGLVEQGIVPAMFAEGSYTKRLEVIADDDLPAGSVLWMFDQTDMAAARRALAGYACIAGNVPTALLAVGSLEEVETYVRGLLDECAVEGGFYLRNGAVLDDARAENVRAMIETARNWSG
jgi:uroporphyrinogen-III decarboxylase